MHVLQNLLNILHREIPVRISPPKERLNLLKLQPPVPNQQPRNLMRQSIIWLRRNNHRFQILLQSFAGNGHSLKRIIRVQRHDYAFGYAAYAVAASAHALNKPCGLPRTHVLNYKINTAHVDAQLKRTRAHKALQSTALQAFLCCYARRLRKRAMMNRNRKISIPNLEPASQNLRNRTRIREQKHRLVPANVVADNPKPSCHLRMRVKLR